MPTPSCRFKQVNPVYAESNSIQDHEFLHDAGNETVVGWWAVVVGGQLLLRACRLCDETVKTWTSKAKDWHVSELVKASCRPHTSICFPHLSSPLHTFLPSDLRGGWRWGEVVGVEGEGRYLYFPPGRVLPAHDPDRLSKAPADRLMSTCVSSWTATLTETSHPSSPRQRSPLSQILVAAWCPEDAPSALMRRPGSEQAFCFVSNNDVMIVN